MDVEKTAFVTFHDSVEWTSMHFKQKNTHIFLHKATIVFLRLQKYPPAILYVSEIKILFTTLRMHLLE